MTASGSGIPSPRSAQSHGARWRMFPQSAAFRLPRLNHSRTDAPLERARGLVRRPLSVWSHNCWLQLWPAASCTSHPHLSFPLNPSIQNVDPWLPVVWRKQGADCKVVPLPPACSQALQSAKTLLPSVYGNPADAGLLCVMKDIKATKKRHT